MKKYPLVTLILFLLLPQAVCLGQTANQISQYGITWTFDREYEYGRFANGDYWVVGPVRIVGINPPSREVSGTTSLSGFTPGAGRLRTMNGSMLNPVPRPTQGYDSDMYMWHPTAGSIYSGNYNSQLNVALNVSSGTPLVLTSGSSLVSTISHEAGGRPQLRTAAVLTVLDRPAPEGSFRPPYSGTDKTIRFNKSQINYSMFPMLPAVSGTPSISSIQSRIQKVWIDHFNHLGDGAQYSSPSENMPNYGREYSALIGDAALLLMLNLSNQGKEGILIPLIQIGIDNYGVLSNGGFWLNNGGLNAGRKLPILLAGFVLNNSNMRNVGNWATGISLPGASQNLRYPFMEDAQTFYVGQADIDATHGSRWNPDSRDAQRIPYDTADIGLPEWGIRHDTDPQRSNKYWGTAYRQCCNAYGWAGLTLAAQIMGLRELWNHDALFDFMDRYMQIAADDGAYPGWRQASAFTKNMWDSYRNDYSPVWVMDNPSDTYSQGRYSGEPPPPRYVLGDVTGDGEINVLDVLLAARHAVGLTNLQGDALRRANVNGDVDGSGQPKIDILDIILIARRAIGL